MEISLCMIVRNEEDCLDNCLRSVNELVDEIIIVDTGSTDRTKEIAARYTDLIYDFKWIDDFAAARNYSFSKAKKEYCMWLDADDVILPNDRSAFLELKHTLDPVIDVVLMPYHYAFDKNGRLSQVHTRERIIKRSSGLVWEDEIHEIIKISGKAVTKEIPVTHTRKHPNTDRDYLILESLVRRGNTRPRILFYYARELCRQGRNDEAAGILKSFLENGGRNTTHCLEACMLLHEYYLTKKQYAKALKISLDNLSICISRSEFCCQLGDFYAFVLEDPSEAVYWYETALKCPHEKYLGQAIQEEYYYFYPYMQLGKVYCSLGRNEEGLKCFTEATKYNSNSAEAKANIANLRQARFENSN